MSGHLDAPFRPMPPAAAPDARAHALDRYLRLASRRALRVASLSGAPDARALVREALRDFVQAAGGQGESVWPVLFWGAVAQRLAGAERSRRTWRIGSRRAPAEFVAESDVAFLQLSQDDATARLDAALVALPSAQRLAFLLRVGEGLDVGATARALGLSDADVGTNLFRALRALRAGLRVAPAAQDDGRWILRCRALLDAAANEGHDAVAAVDAAPPVPAPARVTSPMPTPTPVAAAASVSPSPELRAKHPRAHDALAAPSRGRVEPASASRRRPRIGLWLGSLAVVAGLALIAWRLLPLPGTVSVAFPPPPAPTVQLAPSEDTPLAAPDFDLLADGDDEALLDDLAFHAWLDAVGAHED